jgi:hypothetical protein
LDSPLRWEISGDSRINVNNTADLRIWFHIRFYLWSVQYLFCLWKYRWVNSSVWVRLLFGRSHRYSKVWYLLCRSFNSNFRNRHFNAVHMFSSRDLLQFDCRLGSHVCVEFPQIYASVGDLWKWLEYW